MRLGSSTDKTTRMLKLSRSTAGLLRAACVIKTCFTWKAHLVGEVYIPLRVKVPK